MEVPIPQTPPSDQWNYFIPIELESCPENRDFFDSSFAFNRVSHGEYKVIMNELRKAYAPFRTLTSVWSWLGILFVFLFPVAITVPILMKLPAYIGILSSFASFILFCGFFYLSYARTKKANPHLIKVLNKHNAHYHKRGLHWSMGHTRTYLRLCLYYGLPPGNYNGSTMINGPSYVQAYQGPQLVIVGGGLPVNNNNTNNNFNTHESLVIHNNYQTEPLLT